MLSLEKITDYCMAFPGVTQDFPFDRQTMVFRVAGKMFALVNVAWWSEGKEWINLKCNPERALQLRDQYASIIPGYHMNKKHWNTIIIHEGELNFDQIVEHINHSYALVFEKLSQKQQKELE